MTDKGKAFVKALATYLAGDQAHMSILLSMPEGMLKKEAQKWATLRSQTPLFGYPTVEEAEAVLEKFLREEI